ncbi:hypothetical protein [Sphingomonas sp. NIBR02145]|jgi:hypothetical protein|uniref:hypothetical protein n=1 Tax=Sphingomonas sp. NIBR02145 TaxID=3014784 RepID=UPI0022B50D88|nr:hypothetical protein [Sphingomonas sp. NIBR02145]WHU02388.1 hypothetical protein O3305_19735 [Sphingomonas sp. NIBR02145]
MKQIGGEVSTLFALTSAEWEKLVEAIESDRLQSPLSLHPEGPAGGLVRFRSLEDIKHALLAVA